MTTRFKFRPIPANLADRYPDGDYTVGRGADPRGMADRKNAPIKIPSAPAKVKRKPRKAKKVTRTAAE